MKRKRLTDKETTEIRERLQFLESSWDCQTQYSIDTATGRGSLKITPAAGLVALFLGDVDFRQIGLPTPDRENP